MRKRFLLVTTLLLAGAFLCLPESSPAASEKPIELRFSMWSSMQHTTTVEVFSPFAKELEERTKGRVKVTFYPGETLGKAKDHYDMVVRGIADIAIFVHGYTPGRFPLSGVMDLPIGIPSGKVGSLVMWELYEKYMKQEYSDVKVLSLGTSEPGQLHTTKKSVKTLADLKGLRIRSSGPQQTALLRALGASPLTIPVPELYDALQKGMADGALLPFSAIKDFKLQDVIKHHTMGNLYVMTSGLVMNVQTFAGLPPDVQKIVNELTGQKMVEKTGDAFDRYAKRAEDECRKAGDEIYVLPAAERKLWMEKAKPVSDAWIADMESKKLPGKKVFQEAVALVDKYSK